MKFKTTNKKMNEGFHVYAIPFCELQSLLHYEEPIAYNCGVYGWNCDFYTFPRFSTSVAISTGYRTTGVRVAYDIYRAYEGKAERILHGDGNGDEKREKIEKLLKEFLEEIHTKKSK